MMEARTSKVFKTILGFFNSRVCYHFFFFGLLIVSLGRNTTVFPLEARTISVLLKIYSAKAQRNPEIIQIF